MNLAQLDPQLIARVVPGLEIEGLLGAGGQKAVWKCKYQGSNHALKVLCADLQSTERAKRELEIMRVCESPYLARVGPLPLSVLELEGGQTVLYYLEEFIEGTPLSEVTLPMPIEGIVNVGMCMANAIEALWQNKYVHRDIKPHNIMRRQQPEEYVLLDAGMALDIAGPSLTESGLVVGTRRYLSPDQIRVAKRRLDFRSDLFALGVTMYECATGFHPFWNEELPREDVLANILHCDPPHPQRWKNDLPAEACEIMLRLLEKEPHLRYGRIDHLKEDLRRIQHQ